MANKFSEERHLVCTEWNDIICGRIRKNNTKQCIEFSKDSQDMTKEAISAVWQYYRNTHPYKENGAACSVTNTMHTCLAVFDINKYKLVPRD